MIYGYCKTFTANQNVERQIRNILSVFPDAEIHQEEHTGRKLYAHKEFDEIIKQVKPGDTIVFDSINQMGYDADDSVVSYLDLFDKEINLVFLKEHHIDTNTYKSVLPSTIPITETIYIKKLIEKQIRLTLKQSQKKTNDFRKQIAKGIETARQNGKQIGQKKGTTLHIKKKAPAKALIEKHSKDFRGTLPDGEVMKLIGLSRNTYYKYKKELTIELNS